MAKNILQNIIKKKEIRVAELKKKKPLESILEHAPDSMNYINFKEIKTGKNPFEALQANSIVIHGPKMNEPGYEKPASLGISDIVENRNDISRAVVKYSVADRRKEKIKRGQDLIQGNKAITQNLIAYISEIYKTREFKSFPMKTNKLNF